MHQILKHHPGDELVLRTQIRQYVIGLASHLETYFRDIFRFSIEHQPGLFDKVVQAHGLRLPSPHKLADASISRYDFVAESFTLQSAGSIAEVMDLLFHPEGFRASVESSALEYEVPCRSAIARGFPLSAFPSWWDDMAKIFDLRHEFSHDANSNSTLDRSVISRLESLAAFLPQFVSLMLVRPPAKLLATNRNLPAVLLVEDLLATDWEVADPS